MAATITREEVVDGEMPGLVEHFEALTGHPCAVILIVRDDAGVSLVANVERDYIIHLLSGALENAQGEPSKVWTPPATAKH